MNELRKIPPCHSNGLKQLAGNWNEEEHAAFEKAISSTSQIDEELWQRQPGRAD